MKNKIAVIGGGPAGCAFACFSEYNITIFEKNDILKTLLYTGGGRCNLAYAEFDTKELAKNYPRGEKFLYSVFSKFSTQDTLNFFKDLGIKTYVQEDRRIFPVSNKAKDVRDAIIKKLLEKKTKIINEDVSKIIKKDDYFLINDKYKFEKVVFATGGHAGYEILKILGHNIIEPKPSLVGLVTREDFTALEGVSLKNVEINVDKRVLQGDLIFTKKGISGPLAYMVSSLYARENYSETKPVIVSINFKVNNFLDLLDKNGKKDVKNLLSDFMPKSLASYIVNITDTKNKKCSEISKVLRLKLEEYLTTFPLTIIGHENHGEIVTSGGVDLKEINPKTMESKLIKNLFFCGEVINIDGFCGGFNLQNAWSTSFVASMSMV